MTKEQNKQVEQKTEQTTNVMGWLVTLDRIFVGLANTIFPKGGDFVGIGLCFADREYLRRNLNVNINWVRCLLTPTYVYKRCKLLGEPMTKFYINLGLHIFTWAFTALLLVGLFTGAIPADEVFGR